MPRYYVQVRDHKDDGEPFRRYLVDAQCGADAKTITKNHIKHLFDYDVAFAPQRALEDHEYDAIL